MHKVGRVYIHRQKFTFDWKTSRKRHIQVPPEPSSLDKGENIVNFNAK